ncbi:MAG: hypothetical protein U1A06_05575 [Hoeflea sp.]|nr:hypothetical protein [Hoeflea sp.]
MKHLPLVLACVVALAAAVPAYHWISSSDATPIAGGSHADHAAHGSGAIPSEGGQSAFAAIAEIVALLEADPATDWSKVDIAVLRDHLVDMNSLMLETTATAVVEGDTVRFHVEGQGNALRAIHAMVPAHAAELNASGPWILKAETTPSGAILTVTCPTPGELEKVKALGFFGVMAKGSHHQPHHLAMARGLMSH